MIVADTGDGRLRLVTQGDHAAFAADLLALWPELTDATTAPGPGGESSLRALVLRATRLHDNGWAELDAAPPLTREGLPHDFLSLPRNERLELWRRGVERYAASDPEVAALILEHAIYVLGLSRDIQAEDLDSWRDWRDALHEELGWQDSALPRAAYPWLQAADALSLQVCARWSGDSEVELPAAADRRRRSPMRARLLEAGESAGGGEELRLDPFPLVGASTLHLSCRFVPRRRYASTADLSAELAAARWLRVPCRIAPLA